MIAKYLVPAVAVIGSAAAQCTQATATINAPADATTLASSCKTFNGNILVSEGATGIIDLTGIQQIKGDLKCLDNGVITSLQSSTLSSISGAFELANLTGLSTLAFTSLSRVGTLSWKSLSALDTLTFGTPGLSTATSVVISDTFLSSLDGIDVTAVETLDINNNRRLTKLASKLSTLSNIFNLQANGLDLAVSMPNLIWIANMTVNNVSSFDVPSLQTVNGSARFDSNYFSSFSAPNLTSTKSGDISFIGNAALTNISVPQLTTIGGGLLIANNTALQKIDGFGKLKTVGGAVKLRGNFTSVAFPSLNDVKGAFDISSTNDITSSCDTFKKLAPSKQGGGGQIQGVFSCTSNNQNANSDTGGNTSTTGSGTGSSGGNSAAGITINTGLLGIALVGGFAALL